MNLEEEEYVHLVSCIASLNEAWNILHNVKKSHSKSLVNPAFQFALIEYSKPYKKSYDEVKRIHKLGNEHISSKHLDLHNKIIKARDRVHAHSDLTVDDAKVYVTNTFYGKHVGIAKNVIYDTEMIGEIDAVIDLIEKSLDSMYIKVKQLESALPFHS